jgi:hypothetical protein
MLAKATVSPRDCQTTLKKLINISYASLACKTRQRRTNISFPLIPSGFGRSPSLYILIHALQVPGATKGFKAGDERTSYLLSIFTFVLIGIKEALDKDSCN